MSEEKKNTSEKNAINIKFGSLFWNIPWMAGYLFAGGMGALQQVPDGSGFGILLWTFVLNYILWPFLLGAHLAGK